jgi:hypothetical protein
MVGRPVALLHVAECVSSVVLWDGRAQISMIIYIWQTMCLPNRQNVSGTNDRPSINIDCRPGTLPTAGNWPTSVTSSLDPLPYLWSRYTVCYIVERLLINLRLENRMSL